VRTTDEAARPGETDSAAAPKSARVADAEELPTAIKKANAMMPSRRFVSGICPLLSIFFSPVSAAADERGSRDCGRLPRSKPDASARDVERHDFPGVPGTNVPLIFVSGNVRYA
jgi:hypothetical protein